MGCCLCSTYRYGILHLLTIYVEWFTTISYYCFRGFGGAALFRWRLRDFAAESSGLYVSQTAYAAMYFTVYVKALIVSTELSIYSSGKVIEIPLYLLNVRICVPVSIGYTLSYVYCLYRKYIPCVWDCKADSLVQYTSLHFNWYTALLLWLISFSFLQHR
jgi:hypothetical protein